MGLIPGQGSKITNAGTAKKKLQHNRSVVFVFFLSIEQSWISITHLSHIMVSIRRYLKLSVGIAEFLWHISNKASNIYILVLMSFG